jgi:hypothetical protein
MFDKMSVLNEKIKGISIKEILTVIIFSSIFLYALRYFNIDVSERYFYLIIVIYFILRLGNCFGEFKSDLVNIFSVVSFKEIFGVILLNIFFSYGMLYLADFTGGLFPAKTLGLAGAGSLFFIIIISPVFEELMFRGIFLNKLETIVPTLFAVLISSLLFSALHTFGSIFSAFIFAVCISILYLKSENILVPIFAHFLNNLIGEGIFRLDSQAILFSNDSVIAVMSVLAVISFILIVRYMISSWNNLNNSKIN